MLRNKEMQLLLYLKFGSQEHIFLAVNWILSSPSVRKGVITDLWCRTIMQESSCAVHTCLLLVETILASRWEKEEG